MLGILDWGSDCNAVERGHSGFTRTLRDWPCMVLVVGVDIAVLRPLYDSLCTPRVASRTGCS